MSEVLYTGLQGREEMVIGMSDTAKAMGSGDLEVFATPAMVALMEKTAAGSVRPFLDEGSGTVGISLKIDHTAASPVGASVWCESVLTAIDKRKLTFSVTVFDSKGIIGSGIHERFIINNERFMEKVRAK